MRELRPEGKPPTVKGGAKSGRACEHWDRLGEDLELIKGLGVGGYRSARAEQSRNDQAFLARGT